MKKAISIALALIMLFTLAACGGGNSGTSTAPDNSTVSSAPAESAAATQEQPAQSEQTQQPAEPEGTKVFYFGASANSTTFDPCSDLQTESGNFFVNACGETLWTMDLDGNITYVLATNMEWTDDLTMTITLREGVKFSNGNDFTAEDVIYSIQHMGSTPRTESMVNCVDFENSEIVDDYNINLLFTVYDADFVDTLSRATFCMLDKETCEADGFGWFTGTGPYRLAGDGVSDKSGWVESVHYYLVRNENYWGDAPYYDELYCKFYSEESTRYSDLVAGNLDAAWFSEATYINNLANGAVSGARLVREDLLGVYGISLAAGEASQQTLADINLRKAIAHGIDIATMVETLGEGVYQVATSILAEGSWAYENVGTYEYDPEAAAAFLAEAGYSTSNPITLRVVTESTAINSAMMEAAQAYLSQIGINLDLSGMGDFGTILPTLLANDLDLAIGFPSNGAGTDPASLLQQLGPISNNGLLRVTDPDLVAIYEAASSSRDQAERDELYRQFQVGMHEQYLYIPMWIDTLNYGVSDSHSSFDSAVLAGNRFNPCLLTD